MISHPPYVLESGEGLADPLPEEAAAEGGSGVVQQPEERAVLSPLGLRGEDLFWWLLMGWIVPCVWLVLRACPPFASDPQTTPNQTNPTQPNPIDTDPPTPTNQVINAPPNPGGSPRPA